MILSLTTEAEVQAVLDSTAAPTGYTKQIVLDYYNDPDISPCAGAVTSFVMVEGHVLLVPNIIAA